MRALKPSINRTEGVQEIKFIVKRIEHRIHETGYTFLTAKAQPIHCKKKSGLEEIKIRGIFDTVFEGEGFEAKGSIYDDYMKGPIFIIEGLPLLKEPQAEKEIINFLRKRVDKLGVKTAKDVVETLGLNCLKDISEQGVDLLMTIPNMKEKKAEAIFEAVHRQKTFEPLLAFLMEYKLDPLLATPIYEAYSSHALTTLRFNPYILTTFPHTSFSTADFLALQLGWSYDHHFRVEQAILSCLEERSNTNGDMCVRKPEFLKMLNDFVQKNGQFKQPHQFFTAEMMEEALEELLKKKEIVIEENLDEKCLYIYSRLYYWIESGIVEKLKEMMESNTQYAHRLDQAKRLIDRLDQESEHPFDPKQKEAGIMALINRISILTGGPGTGKTHTTNMIAKAIEELNPEARILLLAPTGKAAKRMTELTKRPAYTIHSAIGLRGSFSDGEETKELDADYILVDESSMIDAFVFLHLLQSVGEKTQILLVGDYEQLPSVGPGLILRDLINSHRIPVTRLTTIFRQAMESQITMNSYAMIQGDFSAFRVDPAKDDFFFVRTSTIPAIMKKILDSFTRMHEKYNFPIDEICVLSPMRKGDLGIDLLNREIQHQVNPPSFEKQECYINSDTLIRVGDRVMQTVNNRELNVFNGEVGYVKYIEIEKNKPVISVEYPDKDELVVYRNKNCEDIQLAYCMTIHKSQGSEFPIVIMPMHLSHKAMLNQNLVYTAWTRAKSKVICIGQEETIHVAMSKRDDIQRLSQIKGKLEFYLPPLVS